MNNSAPAARGQIFFINTEMKNLGLRGKGKEILLQEVKVVTMTLCCDRFTLFLGI